VIAMKIVLTALCVAFVSTAALAEKYPQGMQGGTRADALFACNNSSQMKYRTGGTVSDGESSRRADYSACMFSRGHAN
jgi:hypothetical protein